jgi:hypothetical protein
MQSLVVDTFDEGKIMTEQANRISALPNGGRSCANDSMPKSLSNGNQAFKPVKPANLVRPQGIKPPPRGTPNSAPRAK